MTNLFIAAPDTKAVIDFAATHEAAEVTIEITLNGDELHVYIKRGPDSEILLDDCYDLSHDENRIEFGPESKEDFSALLIDQEEAEDGIPGVGFELVSEGVDE